MTRSNDEQFVQAIQKIGTFRTDLLASVFPLRFVGYGFLALALFDLIALLIPAQFTSPAWGFDLFGQIIERVPVPLLGLMMIFLGENENRFNWEKPLVKFASWLALILAIFYLLMIPLGTTATILLERQNNEQITAQYEQGSSQLQQVKDQLNSVQTDEQMADLLSQLANRSVNPGQLDQPVEAVKNNLNNSLAEGERTMTEKVAEARSTQRIQIFKNGIKWNLEALLSGVLLILVWKSTAWARISQS